MLKTVPTTSKLLDIVSVIFYHLNILTFIVMISFGNTVISFSSTLFILFHFRVLNFIKSLELSWDDIVIEHD